MDRRSFFRLIAAAVVAKPVLPLITPAPVAEFVAVGGCELLDVTRVDVFDRYEFSWKEVNHTFDALRYGMLQRINRDLFADGSGIPVETDTVVEDYEDEDW